jgi:2-oxoglutarate ferredoxin oxidoreductase subunit alpha
MTPVLVLSDAYLANGAEPWKIPNLDALPKINLHSPKEGEDFSPYARDSETLARKWAVPGMPGFEHRLGGLEKQDITGNVSYDPDNHDKMIHLRAEKVQRIGNFVDQPEIYGDPEGDVLIISWGSTYGTVLTTVEQLRKEGKGVSFYHLRWLNPLPLKLGEYIKQFKKVLVPEINMGQLRQLIRSTYLVDAVGFNKVKGQPISVSELKAVINKMIEE